ncbi:MAG: hypothetical protein ACRDZ5_03555 [Acidimicrobiales bacterium]
MEIELTSTRGDDGFTWRAAGARQPKGTIESSLLPSGSRVGDVIRVEAEIEIDGITILGVLPPREKSPARNRIEVVGSAPPLAGVTATLAAAPRRERSRRGAAADEHSRRPSTKDRPRRPEGTLDRPGHSRPAAPEQGEDGKGEDGKKLARPATSSRPSRQSRPAGQRRGTQADASGRGSRTRPGNGTGRAFKEGGRRSGPATTRDGERAAGSGGASRSFPPRRGPVRLDPGSVHRDALIASLAPEERPIAERLVVAGLPGLRRAIAEEQQRAGAEGRPVLSGDPLIEVAERLLPGVQRAAWLDRAEAAVAKIDDISLRDLRTAIGSVAPREEAARELARTLREGLERRLAKLQADWEARLEKSIAEHKVLQALRLSGRPPEPSARFPSALVGPLVAEAGAAMAATTPKERYLSLLEAACESPLRRQIKPAGLAADDSGEVLRRARLAVTRLPGLAPLLGLGIPPPPRPRPVKAAGQRAQVGRPLVGPPMVGPSLEPARLEGAATPSRAGDSLIAPEGDLSTSPTTSGTSTDGGGGDTGRDDPVVDEELEEP